MMFHLGKAKQRRGTRIARVYRTSCGSGWCSWCWCVAIGVAIGVRVASRSWRCR